MRVTVLGSGSRGNAFALSSAGVTLLLDAGFGPKTLIRRAERAGIDLHPLAGIVLTHEHGDHARGAVSLARRHRCDIYGSRGTLQALADRTGAVRTIPLVTARAMTIGPFTVGACPTTHDAREPLALSVSTDGGRVKLGLAYDLGRPTTATRYLLRDATCLLLEANHDEVMLRTGPYPPVVRDRIGGSRGHLSNRAAGQFLAELCHPALTHVVLVHVSERCNRPELAESAVREQLAGRGFGGRLSVAGQDDPMAPIDLATGPPQMELGIAG